MPPVARPGVDDAQADDPIDQPDDAGIGEDAEGSEDAGAGEQDDLAGGENDDDGTLRDEAGPGEVDAPRGPRENHAIRQLRLERQQEREARERAERERDDALRRASIIPGETAAERAAAQRAEQERLALMSPEDRVNYQLAKQAEQVNQTIQQIRFENAQGNDRAAFQALMVRNPFARKNAEQVERLVADEARQGRFISREVALKYIVGESMMKRAESAAPKQKARAAERVNREQARGGDSRGNVPANRSRAPQDERAARRERLRNVPI